MAVIRRKRVDKRAYQLAQRLLRGEPVGPSRVCLVCRRLFDDVADRTSIETGVCVETCWPKVVVHTAPRE